MNIIRKAKRVGVGVLLTLGMLAVIVPAAFADGPNDQSPIGVADGHSLIVTPPVWTIVTGLLLPFFVAFITKHSSTGKFKAVVGVLVAAIAAVVERATLVDGSALITQGLLIDVGAVYLPQIGAYLGFYRQFAINSKLAPEFGVG